jgi:hypothetical protein
MSEEIKLVGKGGRKIKVLNHHISATNKSILMLIGLFLSWELD